jgi:hypothetical protein
VNGEVNEAASNKVELSEDSVLNLITKLKIKLTHQRISHTADKKHKIVCIGDNNTRGFTNILTNLMGDNFEKFYFCIPKHLKNHNKKQSHPYYTNQRSTQL